MLVFGDKVQKQKKETYIELVTTTQPEGPSVLDRVNALEGTEVSLAESGVLDGAFVVNLKDQLENNTKWKDWPDKTKIPHITLAFIGAENMGRLRQSQQTLVVKALGYLAMHGEGLNRKLVKTAEYVRLFVESSRLRSCQITEAIKEIEDVILEA